MAASTEKNANQRVTNSTIFHKLETMDGRLEKLEKSTEKTAEHSIRCAARWEEHNKRRGDRDKERDKVSERLGKLENHNSGNDKKQVAVIAGIVTVIVAVINVLALLIQSGLP